MHDNQSGGDREERNREAEIFYDALSGYKKNLLEIDRGRREKKQRGITRKRKKG